MSASYCEKGYYSDPIRDNGNALGGGTLAHNPNPIRDNGNASGGGTLAPNPNPIRDNDASGGDPSP